ncbi:MAG TPA: hypothetical protein DD713_08035 [Nitrospiraceae bacterium]|nr:hypothetical protein [Nitrospiraceae bacterium]
MDKKVYDALMFCRYRHLRFIIKRGLLQARYILTALKAFGVMRKNGLLSFMGSPKKSFLCI